MTSIQLDSGGGAGGGGGGGATNLGYTPSAANGIVTSSTGMSATIPAVDATNAGLMTPAQRAALIAAAGTNLSYTASPTQGVVVSDTGTDATVPAVDLHVAGLMLPAQKAAIDALATTYQPLDSDLTAIAALTTTAFGRALLTLADAAALGAQVGAEAFKQAQTVNAQTGTTYTLAASDAGKLVTLSNAGAITLTLPQDSDATIAIGTYIDLAQLGAGQVTAVAGTGATLRTSGLTAKARAQYSRLGVQKISANTWSLFGDLAAS